MKRPPRGYGAGPSAFQENSTVSEPPLLLQMPAQARHLAVAAGFVRAAARLAGFDEDGTEAIEIAAMEAVENVIDHARVGGDEQLTVAVSREADDFVLEVRDRGIPWPTRVLTGEVGVDMPPIESERGRGLAMMRALMDEVAPLSLPDGTKVLRMVKRLAQAVAG